METNNKPEVQKKAPFFSKNTFSTDEIAAVIKDSIDNNSLVAKAKFTVDDIKTVLSAVDNINSLDRNTRNLNGTPLNEVDIPVWAKKFILPMEVVYSTELGEAAEDLIVRPERNCSFSYNLGDIHSASARIAQAFRSTPQFVTAADVRKEKGSVNLSSIIATASFDGDIASESGKYFIPIELNPVLKAFFSTYYFNDTAEHILKTYFIKNNICGENA